MTGVILKNNKKSSALFAYRHHLLE